MANTITDNRVLLFNGGDGTGGQPVDLSGVATGTTDTSTYLSGSTSYTASLSNSRAGMLFDAGTAQNYANNHFSLTVNSGVVGLLDTKANGGFTIRFCGATVSNWFEVYVGGSDSWTPTIQGGWANFVVDIELARSTAITNGWTSGTVPATSAIRYVGFSQILTTMPKMADNTWFDTLHRLADGTAGILIQGRNGGTTDWNAADILTQLGSGQMAYFRGYGGSYVLSTPIQIGVNDTTTHQFSDTKGIWLWANQEYAASDYYKISAVGNVAGTTRFKLGTKTGTGDDASGSQGFTISAAGTGVRYGLDFSNGFLDQIDLFGCNISHVGSLLMDNSSVSVISTVLNDVSSIELSNCADFLKNTIVDANTADGVALIKTDDITDIVRCNFNFSDGHAIEIITGAVATQTTKGNKFVGYGADATNDAAVYNNAAISATISVTDGGDSPTVRNGGGASTSIVNNTSITVSNLVDNTEVRVMSAGTDTELTGTENATDGTANNRSFTFSLSATTAIDIFLVNILYENVEIYNYVVPSSDTTLPQQQRFDRVYLNP